MPPANIRPMISSMLAVSVARITRSTTAATRPQNTTRPRLALRHPRRRHADHHGIVARQHDVDQDHLKQRGDGGVEETDKMEPLGSGPARFGRQRHQDGVHIAAGLEAELACRGRRAG